MIDQDQEAAIRFIKKSVYNKVSRSQQGKLKCHLDTGGNPVGGFKASHK